jgi:hypothetical protein
MVEISPSGSPAYLQLNPLISKQNPLTKSEDFVFYTCHISSMIFDTSHSAYLILRHIALWRFNLTS